MYALLFPRDGVRDAGFTCLPACVDLALCAGEIIKEIYSSRREPGKEEWP